jgi:hypothetical protein
MNPIYLYAAILDVLGYKQLLDKDMKTAQLDFQNKLTEALKAFQSVNEAIFRVQAISDTIILTCNQGTEFPEFLDLLRTVFIAFLEQGIFVRGGVAYSRHFQSGHLTYSHAVTRAHELESKVAIYPRIVIDDNIIEMHASNDAYPDLRAKELVCAENGVYFLDILTSSNWSKVYTCAKNVYESGIEYLNNDESAFSKHIRFERYLLASPFAQPECGRYVGLIDRV